MIGLTGHVRGVDLLAAVFSAILAPTLHLEIPTRALGGALRIVWYRRTNDVLTLYQSQEHSQCSQTSISTSLTVYNLIYSKSGGDSTLIQKLAEMSK